MNGNTAAAEHPAASSAPVWAAVFSMSFGVFGLVGAEFLPASLLTPMAADLGVTEGMAGQAVTATAAMGLVASLTVAALTRGIDRRRVLLAFSVLLVLSNLVVAFAANVQVLLLGRILLGAALGGFWSLSTAMVMRLVPAASVPKALSIVVSGVSAATIFAAPVGSYVGDLWGWRAVFAGAAGLGVIAFAIQFATLPSLPPRGRSQFGTLIKLMSRREIALAMLAALMVFTGHMSLFTYIRPFLEGVTGIGVTGISVTLLAFGIANFLGNYLGSLLVARSLRLTLAIMPLTIGGLAFLLAGVGGTFATDLAMIALWGLAFGTVPVAWSAWIARSLPDEAESAGGLLVAAINLAIATGAAVGGVVLETSGIESVFLTSGTVLVLATATILAGVATGPAVAKAA
ncbi:MFS transporter [Chelativorans sp. M5D2P16]|uniref:MFS transporter n=1 Tax=Chelativorans sp. M5D2P16 TaxID=3095678 RepID=UPI002ACA487B|nr:MFS transporter [Chelativorans sp. M5D2P16]MDZ5698081.1 MFS transporter [Chelativorans sp. M5D2P16]